MNSLAALMCAGALASFGTARAADPAPGVELPPGYVLVREDATIRSGTPLHGFQVLDNDTILFRTGAHNLYLAEIFGTCGRGARFDWSMNVLASPGGDIDRYSRVVINGRLCPIRTLTQVDRLPDAPPPTGHH